MRSRTLLPIAMAFALAACSRTPAASAPTSAPAVSTTVGGPEAHRLVTAGARLVDVRSPEEYAAGHIDGAINVPVDEIGTRAAEVGAPGDPVVVYCASGRRAARAASTLTSLGYTRVYDLGAMSAWGG